MSCFLFCRLGTAQVATAPLVPDQRLVNPATLAYRVLRGYTLNLHRDLQSSRAPSLDNSSLSIDTSVDTVGINFGWKGVPYFFELNLLPQFGTQNVASSYAQSNGLKNESESKRQITLVPIQGLFAARLGDIGSVGVKALYTGASFSTDEEYGFSDSFGTTTSLRRGTRSTDFLSVSVGAVLKVFETGLYFGYSSQFIRLIDDIKSESTSTFTRESGETSSTVIENEKATTTLRKDIMGVGYLTKFSGGNIWRIDLSQESMPALDPSMGYEGKLTRLVTEGTWSHFHAGVQVTSTSGYYIDPYRLIPYFFGNQDYYADSVIEYGFFGGLKSAKGHSFGVSFAHSNQTKEQDFGGSQKLTLETTETSYGISYMYAF